MSLPSCIKSFSQILMHLMHCAFHCLVFHTIQGELQRDQIKIPHLCLQLVSLRELPLHLSIHVLLELLHIEQLERLVHVQQPIWQLECFDISGHW